MPPFRLCKQEQLKLNYPRSLTIKGIRDRCVEKTLSELNVKTMSLVPDESIYSTAYYTNVHNAVKMEIKSWVGRKICSRKPKINWNDKNYLNLGCGSSLTRGFINADFYALRWWKARVDWMLDARYPLDCADNTFDGVFSEHMIEHLYPMETASLLKEIYRILKPNAWFRIGVPDLRKYVDYYMGADVDKKFKVWKTGCEAIRSLTQNWDHRSVWDAELLGRFLTDAEFTAVRQVNYREGTDERLCIDRPERRWETLYMEAKKPGV